MLNDELTTFLKSQGGAAIVGFADLHEIPQDVRDNYPFGVSIAVALDPYIISGIEDTGRSFDRFTSTVFFSLRAVKIKIMSEYNRTRMKQSQKAWRLSVPISGPIALIPKERLTARR